MKTHIYVNSIQGPMRASDMKMRQTSSILHTRLGQHGNCAMVTRPSTTAWKAVSGTLLLIKWVSNLLNWIKGFAKLKRNG